MSGEPTSGQARSRLETLLLILTLLGLVLTGVKSWALLPHRIDQVEIKALAVERQAQAAEIMFARIDERLKSVQDSQTTIKDDIKELKARK